MEKTINPFSESALALRRRGVWEAADAGVLLWKNSFVFFLPFFAVPLWICACGLRLIPADFRYLSYLALWWLKPFFDRLVLHVVSRRFFGAPAPSRLGEIRRGLSKNLLRGLLGDLLWRRFSPYRSARMPVRVLERARRKQFLLRKKILAGGGLDFCFLLGAFCFILEAMLLFGEAAFSGIALQMFLPTALSYIRGNVEAVEVFIFIAFCFNFFLAESLYVCMGFGLYINSRVEVEGWDLQLLFQKFAGGTENEMIPGHKRSDGQKKAGGSALAAIFFLCFSLVSVPAVYADSGESASSDIEKTAPEIETPEEENAEPVEYFPENFPVPAEASVEALEAILASPDFGSEKEGWSIRFKNSGEEQEMPDIDLSPWLEKIKRAFAFALRLLVVLAALGFAGFVFFRLKKYGIKGRFPSRGGGKISAAPRVSPESPESLFNRAEAFFARNMLREAWAACLAGCIAACEKYRALSFPLGATEYGCLEEVRSALPSETGGFAELVQNWILFAYGGKTPEAGAFEKSLAYGRALLKVPAQTAAESVGRSRIDGGGDES